MVLNIHERYHGKKLQNIQRMLPLEALIKK